MSDPYLGLLKSCPDCGSDLERTNCQQCDGRGWIPDADEFGEDICFECGGAKQMWWCDRCRDHRIPTQPITGA